MFDWLNGICSLRSFGIAGGVCSGISVFSHCVMGGRGYTGGGIGDWIAAGSPIVRTLVFFWFGFLLFSLWF